ncbi:MAG TPA: chromosomal replication initiator protein DnaA [Phycisphaerae bacterium]
MSTCAQDTICRLESLIAEGVGPNQYKTWFKNATNFTLGDGFLKVAVPNQFVGGWLEKHYSDTIAHAAQQVTGRKLDLAFTIDTDLARSLRKHQPDSQATSVDRYPERLAREWQRTGSGAPGGNMPSQRYRLDQFIVGPCNQLAYSAVCAVSEKPGQQYNPLFVHGGCGLGKTHLLQGLCNQIKEKRAELRWHYTSGEDFTNEFVFALRSAGQDAFRHRYRHVDVLVIDDIHFLANKDRTQEEFLYTFNAIDHCGKQVVMASDAHPKMIGHLSDSLVSRFVSGMVIRVETPGAPTRAELLRRQARLRKIEIAEPVIEFIAERLHTNVRELEGALCKLIVTAEVSRHPITLSLAKQVVDELMGDAVTAVKLSDICSAAAIYFGLKPADLHTSRKTRTIALARGIAMYLARKHTDMSFPEIGRFMGNKNHTTVILACRRVRNMIDAHDSVEWSSGQGGGMVVADLVVELENQLGVGRKRG